MHRLRVVGEGRSQFIADQGLALAFVLFLGHGEPVAGGPPIGTPPGQTAQALRTGGHDLRQILRAFQGTPVDRAGSFRVTRLLLALRQQNPGLQLPALQPRQVKPGCRQRGVLARPLKPAIVQSKSRFVQVHHGQPNRVALLQEDLSGAVEVIAGKSIQRQARLHPGALHQCPGFLDRGLALARRVDRAVVKRDAFRQQIRRAIGIGQGALSLGHALRWSTSIGVAQHQRQPVHGRAQTSAQQFQPAEHVVDGRQQRHQTARLGTLARPFGHLQRLVEAVLRRQHAGQSVVGHDRVRVVAHPGEPQRRAPEVRCRVGIAILAQQQRTQVLFNLAGRQLVAAGIKSGQGTHTALDRFAVAPQHGQTHHLGHPGVFGCLNLALRQQGGFGTAQHFQCVLRLSAHERSNAFDPNGEGVDPGVPGLGGHARQRSCDGLCLTRCGGPGPVTLAPQFDRQVAPRPRGQPHRQRGLVRIGIDPDARPGRRCSLRRPRGQLTFTGHGASGRGTSKGGNSITRPDTCSDSCTGPPGTWSKRNSSISSSAT